MNYKYMDDILRRQAEKKFYGHDKLVSKYKPRIPESAEREYKRMANAYMKILKEELEVSLPKLKEEYRKALKDEIERNKPDLHEDGITDLILLINKLFAEIKERIISKITGFNLRRKLELIANINRKLTIKEWKKVCKKTLGIDIFEDYYLGSFYQDNIEKWIDANVELIKTIPTNSLDKMKEKVLENFDKGGTSTDLAKELMRIYGIEKNHAMLIARDQTAKLYSSIQKAQQEDAGITEYIWSGVGDERERASHRALNGHIFSWSQAPVNSDGRQCHPGEDFQCRCIARPVFNRSSLTLPVEMKERSNENDVGVIQQGKR